MIVADMTIEKTEATDEAERQALYRKQHARRLLASIVVAGYTVTGVRLSDPKTEHADGVVVGFSADEAAKVTAAIRGILEARGQ
jgi:hypothetical protein